MNNGLPGSHGFGCAFFPRVLSPKHKRLNTTHNRFRTSKMGWCYPAKPDWAAWRVLYGVLSVPVDGEIKGTCYNTPYNRAPGSRDSAWRVSQASTENWLSLTSRKHAWGGWDFIARYM